MSAEPSRATGRRFLRDRKGGAALEFAMLGPVLLMFMIGFFQVAWAMYCASSVRYALHNSARVLVLNPGMSQADFQTMVKAAVTPLAAQDVTVTLVKTSPNAGLQLSTATATYNYQIVIPFIPTYNGQFTTSFLQSGTNF
ncbi:MAG: TadE/TadG family type IV pilus assembly protein [Caulobacteraceae bacterium]